MLIVELNYKLWIGHVFRNFRSFKLPIFRMFSRYLWILHKKPKKCISSCIKLLKFFLCMFKPRYHVVQMDNLTALIHLLFIHQMLEYASIIIRVKPIWIFHHNQVLQIKHSLKDQEFQMFLKKKF